MRDGANIFMKDGSSIECNRFWWIVSGADFVQCDRGNHAVDVRIEEIDFEKTFGPGLAQEYSAMKDELSEAHDKSRQRRESSRVAYPAPEMEPSPHPGAAGGETLDADDKRSLDDLLKILTESDSAVEAYNAARAIKRRAGGDYSRAIAPLVKHLNDERPVLLIFSGGQGTQPVADEVKNALVRIGSPAVPALIDLVKGSRPGSKNSAANRAVVALGEIRDPRAVQVLALHAQGPKDQYSDYKLYSRRSAVQALGNIKTPEAWNALASFVRSGDGSFRLDAAWGLYKIDESRSGPAIDPYIDAILAKAEGSDLRRAVNLAGSCGFKRLAPNFIRYLGHAEPAVVSSALGALVAVGPPSDALPGLLRLTADRRYNDAATRAISTITDPAAVRGLINGLSHSDAKARWACAWALGEIKRSEAVPALAVALADQDRETRYAALHALGKIGGADADRAIRGFAESANPMEKKWAEDLLRIRPYGN